jgi:hypothetical protein
LIGEAKEVAKMSTMLAKYDIPNFPNLEDMVKNLKILVLEAKNKEKSG